MAGSEVSLSRCVPYCNILNNNRNYLRRHTVEVSKNRDMVHNRMWNEKERDFCLGPRRVKVKIEIFHFSRLCHFMFGVETADVKLSMGYYGVIRRWLEVWICLVEGILELWYDLELHLSVIYEELLSWVTSWLWMKLS